MHLCVLFVLLFSYCVFAIDPPKDWIPRIQQAQLFYSAEEPDNVLLMPYVGNGFVATQINSDSIYINGIYNGPAVSDKNPSHRARIPNFLNFRVQNFDSLEATGLDIERAIYFRRWWNDDKTVHLEQRFYAHRSQRSIMVHETVLLADSQTTTEPISVCLTVEPGAQSTDFSMRIYSQTKDYQIIVGQTLEPEVSSSDINFLAMTLPSNLCFTLQSNNATFSHILSFKTSMETYSRDFDRLASLSLNDYTIAKQTSLQQGTSQISGISTTVLLDQHLDAWKEIWTSGIEVDNFSLAQVFNTSLYYILSSVRNDLRQSTSPGSLSSNSYNGHVFWDSETWMYPNILLLHPDIARSFIFYRYERMGAAANKAKSYNPPYQGTMFPWESAQTGAETCPLVAATGLYEQHITGDIAFAAQQYWTMQVHKSVQSEYNFANGTMIALMLEIGKFWESRVSLRSESSSVYEIRGVIPPDEYHENCNNSVYTNAVAQLSFSFALQVCKEFKLSCPTQTWSTMADNLYFPYDTEKQIYLEFEEYKGDTIKQADVILLDYPLQWKGLNKYSPQTAIRNLEYYGQKVDQKDGPAMSFSMDTISWLKYKNFDQVALTLPKSYANAQPPYYVWFEAPGQRGAVNFITGAGGFLQIPLFGLTGLRMEETDAEKVLHFDITLIPKTIESFKIRNIKFMQHNITVAANAQGVSVMDQGYSNLYIRWQGMQDKVLPKNVLVPIAKTVFDIVFKK